LDGGRYPVSPNTTRREQRDAAEGPDRRLSNPLLDWFKSGVGLEMEWNNKDPFYDRDLNKFRLLF
jgi:hypothetical protein